MILWLLVQQTGDDFNQIIAACLLHLTGVCDASA